MSAELFTGPIVSSEQRHRWEAFEELQRFCVRVVLGMPHDQETDRPVFIPALPGVVSQGKDESECIDNIKEAFGAVIEEYLESGESIPWQDDRHEPCAGEEYRWIWIDAR